MSEGALSWEEQWVQAVIRANKAEARLFEAESRATDLKKDATAHLTEITLLRAKLSDTRDLAQKLAEAAHYLRSTLHEHWDCDYPPNTIVDALLDSPTVWAVRTRRQ